MEESESEKLIEADEYLSMEKRRARLRRQRIELEAELDDDTHEALIEAGQGGTY